MNFIKIKTVVVLMSFNAAFAGTSLDDYSIVSLSSDGDADHRCEAYVLAIKSNATTKLKGKFLDGSEWCSISIPRDVFSKKFEMCGLTSVSSIGSPVSAECHLNIVGGTTNLVEFSAKAYGDSVGNRGGRHNCKWACKNATR